MDAIAIIAIILSIYGAILSTILAIHEIRKGKPNLNVCARHGYLYDGYGKPSEPVILMEAINSGSGSISLNGVGWMNRDGSKQHLTNSYPEGILPMVLDERRKCTTAYACRWFRKIIDHDKVKGLYFQDETGKLWYSKVSKKVIKTWLNSTGEGWRLDRKTI